MATVNVEIRRVHPDAVIPSYAMDGDACFDLTAVLCTSDMYDNLVYDTGLAFAIPPGHVGLLFPRSSVSRTAMALRNSVGVIDSGYRGTVMLKFANTGQAGAAAYKVGDRVGQMMVLPLPTVHFEEVEAFASTARGEGGFGSTGQ
jgi:dUTP pyrophosphatase